LEAAGVTKDYFGGILSSNDIYIYIYIKTVKKKRIRMHVQLTWLQPILR
jgi:hypothetical protein